MSPFQFLTDCHEEGYMGGFTPSGRNFGYGKQLMYAGKTALRDKFGGRHFGSVASYDKRWARFAEWVIDEAEVRDARHITLETFWAYARELREALSEGALTESYARSCVSAANIVLAHMRRDRQVWISPVEAVGPRGPVRAEPPIWMDRLAIQAVVAALSGALGRRVVGLIWLGRELGLHWKECALLDAVSSLSTALARGMVKIERGTRKGRPRVLPITSDRQIEALRLAAEVQGRAKNLVPAGLSYRDFAERASRVFYAAGGRRFDDLRGSYACDRYQVLTGWAAPVLGGVIREPEVDRTARQTLAQELGQQGITWVAAYVGGRSEGTQERQTPHDSQGAAVRSVSV